MRSEKPFEEQQPDLEGVEWDAHDKLRQRDQFAPPQEACECACLHCRRTFMSDHIWYQKIKGSREALDGFWMCPTANCGGAGFTFDIFPTDPNHPANEGWFHTEEEDDLSGMESDELGDHFEPPIHDDSDSEYDSDEPQYKMLDGWTNDDNDMDGEEWKYGLEPGQRPAQMARDWESEEEKKFNAPDQRPRELDWTDVDRPEGAPRSEGDLPF